MANTFSITCPVTCTTTYVGAIEDNSCLYAPENAEVNALYLAGSAALPTDWTAALDWVGLVDNTTADTTIKKLRGIGDVGEHEVLSTFQMADGNELDGEKQWTLTFDINNVGPLLYDELRELQCGEKKPNFVYTTRGGFMFGQQTWIEVQKYSIQFPKDRGDDSAERATITITWRASVDPQRITSPV